MLQRILRPLVDLREEEGLTALLMFAYSFLAMAGYNVVKPATRSQFIDSLGADNIPYVQLVAGLIMGFVIQGYTSAMRLLPRRWVFAATQAVMVGLLVLFWSLFKSNATWVSVAFYLWGVLAGSLLISQFWSLANDIYDARQAKRVFGFIGGGASLGGIIGAGFAGQYARAIGTNNLLLVAAVFLAACGAIVSFIAIREKPSGTEAVVSEKGISPREAVSLLIKSKHFQIIALVISFAAVGAGIVEQQVNMAAQQWIPGKDGRTAFLANVIFYSSIAGFFIQMTLTSRLHRLLGIGFALLLLPFTLGATGFLMLATGALWSATTARVLDTSLRYTVDKTTREILFMPLPTAMKYRAKPFADVAVDRFAKGLGAALLIVAIKFAGLTWWQLSYVSITVAVLWLAMAMRARREYLQSFRQSLASRVMEAKDLRVPSADLSTIETLMQELAQPDPVRVVYAIDMLESLDKRSLVTPLLLYHESPEVRRRALQAIGSVRRDIALNWLPQLRRMLSDADAGVRAASIAAIGNINNEDAASLSRPLLTDPDPRIRVTAAVALAASRIPGDVDAAEGALIDLASDSRSSSRSIRRDVAAAIRQLENPRFRRLLIPLLYDEAPEVAHEAMESVQAAGTADFIFVPTLVALLRNRQLKARARGVIVSYGEPVVDVLAHFLRDPDEDIWVRRHIPTSLAQIPSQKSVDVLIAGLTEEDGFLRYKVIAALDRLRRTDAPLSFPRETLETHTLREGTHFFNYLSLYSNLSSAKSLQSHDLLTRTLEQKMERTKDRIYRLLSLIYPWRDIGAAQWTLAHGDGRSRASASEYLDNILTGQLRKRMMAVLEDLPIEERVKRGNVLLKTRPRDLEDTLLHLINDDDQVVAAVAIDVVRQSKMWTLGDDIEHVLAHRDVHDWYVFETASWALAEQRMPADRRRELWLEPLPASEIAGRIRTLPLFASVSVDELFRIASTARQVRHQPGTVLLQEGIIPDTIHVLLDGHVVESGTTARPGPIDAPASLGFAQALQGVAMRKTVRTADAAVTLALTVDELNTLLADNTDLVRGFFATLAKRVEPSICCNVQSTGATTELRELAADGLLPVEKILALQRLPVFSRIAPDEMAALAATTETIAMKSGSPLFAESAPVALWVILSGEVSIDDVGGGNPSLAHAGDVIGSLSMLSGQPLGKTADVLRGGIALRLDRDALFDLLGERPELLRQLFEGMFKVGAEASAPTADAVHA